MGASLQQLPPEPSSSSSRPNSSSRQGTLAASLQQPPPEPPAQSAEAFGDLPNAVPEVFEEVAPPPPPPPPQRREEHTLERLSQEYPLKELGLVRRDFGDNDDHLSDDDLQPPPPRGAALSFSCTRGKRDKVAALSFSGSMSDANLAASQWLGTMSSPAAIQGTNIKWVRGESVGRGTLGNVFQALDQETGSLFAVKEVLINTSDAADLQFKHALENEIQICSALKHPSIVTYLGHDSIADNLYIYMEYMIGGSMSSVLHQFGAFEEGLISKYARDMLEGLDYLHTRSPPVLHRDIKSANVLMGQSADGGELCAKLADFGCSKRNADTLSTTLKGTIPWMAPEVVKNVGYGRMADIWSFGCVIIEMGTAQPPWGKFDNQIAAMYKIGMSSETPPLPTSFSERCVDFTQRCLQREPTQRAGAADLLQHPFVVEAASDDD